MLNHILLGVLIGFLPGLIFGGSVGVIAGYDWAAGQFGRVLVIRKKPDEPSQSTEEEHAPQKVWLPPIKGPLD